MHAQSNECLQDYVEKTIKISQKANNDKGFGFTLGGGADKKQPVVVEKVGLGKDKFRNDLMLVCSSTFTLCKTYGTGIWSWKGIN